MSQDMISLNFGTFSRHSRPAGFPATDSPAARLERRHHSNSWHPWPIPPTGAGAGQGGFGVIHLLPQVWCFGQRISFSPRTLKQVSFLNNNRKDSFKNKSNGPSWICDSFFLPQLLLDSWGLVQMLQLSYEYAAAEPKYPAARVTDHQY